MFSKLKICVYYLEGSTVRVITNEELKNLSQHLAVQGIPVNAETLRLMRRTQRKEEKRAARRAKKGRSAGHNLQGTLRFIWLEYTEYVCI